MVGRDSSTGRFVSGGGGNAGTLNVVLTASTRGFAKNISGAIRQLGGLKMAVQNAGLAAGASFASFAMVGRGILKAGGDFERGMVRAGAIAQATDGQMKEMRRTALSLSQATEFTARQVADAFGNMAQQGLRVNQVMGAAPSVLQLASAAQLGVADASLIATKVMNSYSLGVGDLVRVNDSLIAVSNNAATDVRSIGEAFKYVGGVGNAFQIDMEEMFATIGLFGNVGVPAEMAGAALANLIPIASSARNATGKTRKIMDELGLTALSVAKNGFPAIADIVDVVRKRIAETGDEALVAAQVMEVFDKRAGRSLVSLSQVGGDKIRELTKTLKDAGGVAEDISRRQLNTFDGRMKILASQAEALAITFADDLIPIITKLGDGVSGLIGYFKALPAATRKSMAEIGAFVAASLAALSAISLILTVMSPLASVFASVGRVILAALSKPLLVVGGIISGLILAIGALRKAWDNNLFGMRDALSSIGAELKDLIDGFRSTMKAEERVFESFRKATGIRITQVDGRVFFQKESEPAKPAGVSDKQQAQFLGNNVAAILEALPSNIADGLEQPLRQLLTKATGSLISSGPEGLEVVLAPDSGPAPKVPTPGPGFAEQAAADVKDTFMAGLSTFMDGAVIAGDFLKEAAPDGLKELQAVIASGSKTIKEAWEAIKNGSLSSSAATADVAKNTAKAGRLISFSVRPMSTSIDSLSDLFGALGSSLKKAMKDFGKAFDFMGRLGIMPSITRDKDGAITGTDPGSLLGGSKVGGILQAGMQGAALGGPLGALAGILAELLIGAEVFRENLEFSGDTLGLVGDALASFGEPLRALHGQMRILTTAVMKPLTTVMTAFGKVFQAFTPIIKLVTYLVEIVAVVLDVFAAVLDVFSDVVLVIVQAIVVVARIIIAVVLVIVRAIVEVWNGIVGAVAWVFEQLAKLPVVGGLFGKVANAINSLKVNTEGLDRAFNDLTRSIITDADGSEFVKGSINEGMEEFGKNLSDVNEELTNVPRGFKVALARFNAIQVAPSSSGGSGGFLSSASDIAGTSIPALASGGVALGPTLALVGERGPEAVMPLDYLAQIMGGGGGRGDIHIGTLTLEANDPFEMAQKLEDVRLRRLQLETGVAAYGGAQYTRG